MLHYFPGEWVHMELTDALFTCLISLYNHLFDANVFSVTFAMRTLVVSLGREVRGKLPYMGYIGMCGLKG